MKCLIGLGSNQGDRRQHLEQAARALQLKCGSLIASPIVENPALLLPGAPLSWRQPFLNAVVEVEWSGSPSELLRLLNALERQLGRVQSPRWSPRCIDLDLLTFGEQQVSETDLQVPHVGLWDRSFVLVPLKHLRPSLSVPGHAGSVLSRSRELAESLPLWMGILNFTPDSFSDGGQLARQDDVAMRLAQFEKAQVQIIDVGAESTRPGARPVTPAEEWARLQPHLELIQAVNKNRIFRPWISVDTRHPETAVRAIELGVDIVNDVSGARHPGLLEAVRGSNCQYVLMHSLSVPADPSQTLSGDDPVGELREWFDEKVEQLLRQGLAMDRVILDPGIGFGKTAAQSWQLLAGVKEFMELPLRILVGHSRKSLFDLWGKTAAPDRDAETLGVSLQLAQKGVDILRVHAPELHQRAWRAFQEAK